MIVFTPIHPLTGASLSGGFGTTLNVPKEPVISEGKPLYQWFDGMKFQIGDVKVDAFLVPENTLGRRPPTMAEIQKILKCAKQGTTSGWKAWSRSCVSTGSSYCQGHCDTNAYYYSKGLRQFYVGSSTTYFYDTQTGEVVVTPQSNALSAAYSWIVDNLCWIAAGTLVATGGGATMAVKVKATCDAVRASMRGSGGAPAPGADSGFDPDAGNIKPEKPSWISEHPVATGAIAVGGMGAIGAVLMAIFRR